MRMTPLILSKVKNDLMSLKHPEHDGEEGGFQANRIHLQAKTFLNNNNFLSKNLSKAEILQMDLICFQLVRIWHDQSGRGGGGSVHILDPAGAFRGSVRFQVGQKRTRVKLVFKHKSFRP